ncbi:hypothetical protein SAMN05720469_11451 [Fibrobacter intestinalis]|uniref:Uncharacterized protein n=1 Tax=Fibrobacter intestinalis TaxID=28122 RepID=A0A1M6UKZ3_9BACT|nr:hypothetical protein [Fibrobacter intestinalis]SHK69856.1 hypothetical protein SAMN05720469_11451 [Fibrobacter intestinalis]
MKKLVIVSVPYKPFMSVIKDGCTLPNVEFLIIERKKHFVWKILFRIFLFLKCFRLALRCKISNSNYRDFQNYAKDPDVKFLFWSPFFLSWWYAMGRLVPKQEKAVFCWGPLNNAHHIEHLKSFIKLSQEIGIDFYTMNPFDAQNHQMIHTTQVYRNFCKPQNFPVESDFYFLGKTKGREKTLTQLQKKLERKGFKLDFHLFEDVPVDPVPFEQNVLNAQKAKCIVDIVSPKYKQDGMTLRPLEALFLGKKLLTNYAPIKECDFYHPDNIFVLDENNSLEGIEEFMAKPMHPIPKEIVEQYEVNHWLQKYFLKNDQPT